MFSGDDALKKISVLSGGEKSRVMLGKVLATPVNLLLLDEPSNHLDMESCDALLAAIDSFDGTVIMVTHNEMFLHALADRLIVFQNGGIEVFEGSYQRFLEKGGWGDDSRSLQKSRKNSNGSEKVMKLTKKDLRRRRSEIISMRSKAIKPLELRMARTENEIGTRENELERLNQAMQLASRKQDGRHIAELSQQIHSCRSDIDRLFEELEKINTDLEAQKSLFEQQLEQLEPATDN
jgi:ATP-binding cassette subfamily F protein 3